MLIHQLVLQGILSQFKCARKGKPSTTSSTTSTRGEDKGEGEGAPTDAHADAVALKRWKAQEVEDCTHKEAQHELDKLLIAAELDHAYNVDEEDDCDEDREATDDILIDALDDEHPKLMITGDDIRFTQMGFQKVSCI